MQTATVLTLVLPDDTKVTYHDVTYTLRRDGVQVVTADGRTHDHDTVITDAHHHRVPRPR